MKQEIKLRVRQYATGEIVACSHHEIENEGMDLDEIASNYTIGEDSEGEVTYREFDIIAYATPPVSMQHVNVALDVADAAETVAADIPDPVPA